MNDIEPLPCPWCREKAQVFGGEVVWISCGNPECDGIGPHDLDETEAVIHWNRVAQIKDQHARAISILRRIVNGYRPAHGSMEAWDDALALLREVDGGVIADTR